MNAREMIHEFHTAFGRPINYRAVYPTEEERLLRAKLLLEEVAELIQDGLGIVVSGTAGDDYGEIDLKQLSFRCLGDYDPIETADGLGDVEVIIHGSAWTFGINLDEVTKEIHRSNMSKLDANGKPIINGETPGYRYRRYGDTILAEAEAGYDPSKPVGKILKSDQFFEPSIATVLQFGNEL